MLGIGLPHPVLPFSTGDTGLKDPKIVRTKIWRKLLARALSVFVAICAYLAQELSAYPVTKHHLLL